MLIEWCDGCFEDTEHFVQVKPGRIACKKCRARLRATVIKPPLPKRDTYADLARPPCPRQHPAEWNRRGACKACARERARDRYSLVGRTAAVAARALWASARARAKQLGRPFDLNLADCEVPVLCPVFGLPFDLENSQPFGMAPSLDRIKPELGYVHGNVVVISRLANAVKNCATRAQVEAVAGCDAIWPKA